MTITSLKNQTSPHTAYWAFETPRDPEVGMSPISRWKGFYYLYSDQTASEVSVMIPRGTRMLRVAHEVHTAFTGVTAMTIGDGSAADGWIATAVISPTAATPEFVLDYDSTYAAVGKLYMDGDTLDIAFAGIATAGSGIVWMEFISYGEAADAEA